MLSLSLQHGRAIRYNLPKKTGGFPLLSLTQTSNKKQFFYLKKVRKILKK